MFCSVAGQIDVLDGRERAKSKDRIFVDDWRGETNTGQRATSTADWTRCRLLQEPPRVLV